MKKLLLFLSIAALTANQMQAQPVAKDARLDASGPSYFGELNSLVEGGTPPYNYTLQQAIGDDIEVSIQRDGKFIATAPMKFNGATQFEYIAADATGDVSNPGTITIKFGKDKL